MAPDPVPTQTERVARLPLLNRLFVWIWIAMAFILLAFSADPAIVMGAVVMAKLTQMDNDAQRRALVFAWQADRVAEKVWNG